MAHHIYIIEYCQNGNTCVKAVYGKALDNNQIVYNTEISVDRKKRTASFETFDKKTITYTNIGFYYDFCIGYNFIDIPKHIEQYHKKQNKYKTIKQVNGLQPGDLLYVDNGNTKKVVKLLKTIRYIVSKIPCYLFYRLDNNTIKQTPVSIVDRIMNGDSPDYPNTICVKLNEENKLKYL